MHPLLLLLLMLLLLVYLLLSMLLLLLLLLWEWSQLRVLRAARLPEGSPGRGTLFAGEQSKVPFQRVQHAFVGPGHDAFNRRPHVVLV